jgi:hypothetical protein
MADEFAGTGVADAGMDAGSEVADTGAETVESGTETVDTGAESTEQQAEFELDENGEQKLDEEGNPIPKEQAPADSFKTTYDKIKAADPKAAEMFRKEHFSLQQFTKAFGTPAEAAAAKELFETYGGEEGLEELSGRAEQFASEMDAFSKGDPALIDMLAKDDPEGFAKVGAPYLTTLSKVNSAAYDAMLAPIMVSTLDQTGITAGIAEAGNILDALYGSLKAAGVTQGLPEITQAFNALKKAYDAGEKLKKIAEQSAQRPVSDKEKALAEKEKALTQKERDTFYSEVQKQVTQGSDALIDKALQTYYKQFPKITKDQKADLHNGVFDYIAQQLKSNAKYQKQLRTMLQNGEADKAVKYVAQNVGKLLQNGAAKTIWNRRGFGVLPNVNKGTGNANTGTVNLTLKPKRDDIDWNLTPEAMYMAGEAILKGSKRRVKWDWTRI